MAAVKSLVDESSVPAAFSDVRSWYDSNLAPSANRFDDPRVYSEVYGDGRWAGVFQCVGAGTRVLLSSGDSVPIESIAPGTSVATHDLAANRRVNARVEAVHSNGRRSVVRVRMTAKLFKCMPSAQQLICTPDHLVLADEPLAWKRADALQPGEKLRSMSGRWTVDSVEPAGEADVWDLTVPGPSSYVAAGVVVHNCTQPGAQRLFRRAKPKSIVDVATLTSIYRPGPLAAKLDELYLKAKSGEQPFDWGDPRINKLLEKTHGCLIFQEQVLQLARDVAGYSLADADVLRKAIMKRSIAGAEEAKKKTEELRKTFVAGAIANGYSREVAEGAFDKIAFYSGYGFNACLHPRTLVTKLESDGRRVEAELCALRLGDVVESRDERTGELIGVRVKAVHAAGRKRVVRATLASGATVTCTLDHKFRTEETGEMLPLSEIFERGLSIAEHPDRCGSLPSSEADGC